MGERLFPFSIKGAIMHKTTKRALALLLACTLVFSSGMRSRSYAMAGGGVIAGGGAVIGAETALAYMLGILGFSAASAVVYDNRDSIAKWGKEQAKKLDTFIADQKENIGCTVESMQDWLTKLGKGTLDTAAAEWTAFRSWVGSLYKTGTGGGAITNQNDFTFVDGAAAVGNFGSWVTPMDMMDGDERYVHLSIPVTDANKNAFFFSYGEKEGSSISYYIALMTASAGTLKYYTVNKTTGTTYATQTYKAKYAIGGDGWYMTNPVWIGHADAPGLRPNFIGVYESSQYGIENTYYDMGGRAYKAYLEHKFDAPTKAETYKKIGGISSSLDAGKTIDNISVVGVGNKAGVTDVTIPWPKDNTMGGLIGGAITGTNTWTDVIDAAGVGVISRENEKDYVIDNTGVTTKEWDYATDIPGTGDIDKPGTDTGDTDADVSKDLSDYTFAGLEKIFPFCLPFDLIDFIGVLDADPEAPKFTIPIKVPTDSGWGVYDIDIDLSKFDSVAALLRQMETLAFVVGLIMITRQKMIRG